MSSFFYILHCMSAIHCSQIIRPPQLTCISEPQLFPCGKSHKKQEHMNGGPVVNEVFNFVTKETFRRTVDDAKLDKF